MSVNNFLPFSPTDTGTNLLSQTDYAAATDRTIGNQPGIASAKLNNKALRQATAVASQLAQYLSDSTSTDLLDDGNENRLLAQINAAMGVRSPVVTKYLTGAGTWQKSFIFGIASGNATIGATYTNNTFTFTVTKTVAAGVVLETTGTGAPTVSGTLVKATGTGDATLTFYVAKVPLYIHVRGIGGGGGGAGSATLAASDAGDGTAGNDTTFGSSLLFGGGGGQGKATDASAPGGTASLGSGPIGIAIPGGQGQTNSVSQVNLITLTGGLGASSPFAGGGAGGKASPAPGVAGPTNSGTGGGGAGGPDLGGTSRAGGGGSAGGYFDAVIYAPNATYAYSVGAPGTGGTAGTSGAAGAAGGEGFIEVTEYFQ